MLNRTVLTVLLAILGCSFAAGDAIAASSSGAVVFSRTFDGSHGLEGGLYAARDGRFNQLTENPADGEPDFSSDGRAIAFVRAGDVWTMRADGSGQHVLTSGPEVDGRPLIAPNGRYVVFERRAAPGAPRDLYTVRIGGGEAHPLAASPTDEHEATFSPDGCMIAFVRSVSTVAGGGADDLYSVRPAGIGLRRLTRTRGIDEFAPRYFDDDDGIVFSRGQSGEGPAAYADVYAMRSNGLNAHPLIRGAGSAHVEDVSPNGRLLLFRRDQGLWTKPLLGSGRARKLIQLPDGSATNAVFSSDGRRVAAFVIGSEGETLSAIDARSGRSSELAEGEGGSSLEGGSRTATIGPVIAWQPVR